MGGYGWIRFVQLAGGVIALATGAVGQTPVLQFSSSQLGFAAIANGPAPAAQLVTITAADGSFVSIKALADGGTTGTPEPAWLSVTPTVATTPAQIHIAVDQTGLPAGAYSARLQITDAQGRLLGPVIPISLQVTLGSAQLDASPAIVEFAGSVSAGNLQEELLVRNDGPGSVAPVSVTIVSGYPWLSAATTACETICAVSVRAAVSSLQPGAYRGLLRVTTAIGTQEVPVSLFAADHGPFLQLSAAGAQFYGVAGSGLADSRTITILNNGDAPANWSADVVDGQAWLTVSPAAGVIAPQDSAVLTITMNSGSLAAQELSGLVRVSAQDGSFGPIDIPAILHLDPPGTAPVPLLSTGGLVFQLQTGAEGIQQPLTLAAASANPVAYQASPVSQGSLWLSVSPVQGQLAGASPADLSAIAASVGVQPGFYGGGITVALGAQSARTLHAGFSVTDSTQGCVPEQLYLTETGIADGFATRTGFPTALQAVLVDDCGNFVSNALVSATFSNGDPGIPMEPVGLGQYAGTWVPSQTSGSLPGGTVSAELRAVMSPLAPGFADVVGTVSASALPAINAGGVVNNLNSLAGAPIAPGAVIQIYGSQFGTASAGGTIVNGQLSTTLGGVSVSIGDLAAPLYYASSGQINAQVPMELAANRQYQVIVSANGLRSNAESIHLAAAEPGIAVYADGSAIAQDVSYNLITAQHPAHAGDVIILYLTGMGATSPPVPTGVPAPASPLAEAIIQPQVTVDGAPAQLLFAGLSPGSVGLYQVDVQIPPTAQSGDLAIVVNQAGAASNTATIPVQ
ncbi:MAG TPA: hypothetical protein VMB25_18220 [Bryobacteraceae bacterium]|nr:hypothetical protein [Bryobacteraceae bacterium]